LQHFRQHLKNITKTTSLPMDVAGFGGDVNDSLIGVYSAWPIMAGGVSIVVLCIMGFSFRSVLIALRGVVTIGITIVFVSGLAKLAYCDGVFSFLGDFAGFDPSAAKSDLGMVWIVQPTIFPLMVGIALDYDIFLVGRICELHDGGMSTRDSILMGVASTGTIITAAGVIQGLAFFGLMMSEILVLNQLSFFLFFAVVFDTLVVRTLVVPSLMFWVGFEYLLFLTLTQLRYCHVLT
jgi:putative drug exporter of the RND superfamily